jgi:hypothetical protein
MTFFNMLVDSIHALNKNALTAIQNPHNFTWCLASIIAGNHHDHIALPHPHDFNLR